MDGMYQCLRRRGRLRCHDCASCWAYHARDSHHEPLWSPCVPGLVVSWSYSPYFLAPQSIREYTFLALPSVILERSSSLSHSIDWKIGTISSKFLPVFGS